MEEMAALFVAILSGSVALIGLSFVKDRYERTLLTRLFFSALGVRLVFTLALYASGLVNTLGGMDDTIWTGMWGRSRHWGVAGPDSVESAFGSGNIQANAGWVYAGSWFYYLLNMRSQLALAALNCFLNALVVLVIYKTAREFFEEKACRFVAWIAVFMPGFLIWSALTVKETWLIFFEITTFYLVWRMSRRRDLPSILPHAALIGLAGACNVEGRAMIDRGPDERQADRHVHARLEAQHLHGTRPLIVIHGHDQIEIIAPGPEKQRIGRQGPIDQ